MHPEPKVPAATNPESRHGCHRDNTVQPLSRAVWFESGGTQRGTGFQSARERVSTPCQTLPRNVKCPRADHAECTLIGQGRVPEATAGMATAHRQVAPNLNDLAEGIIHAWGLAAPPSRARLAPKIIRHHGN